MISIIIATIFINESMMTSTIITKSSQGLYDDIRHDDLRYIGLLYRSRYGTSIKKLTIMMIDNLHQQAYDDFDHHKQVYDDFGHHSDNLHRQSYDDFDHHSEIIIGFL